MKRNEKGFGIIEALLLIVIVGMLGGAGWLVHKSQKATNNSLDNSKNSLESAKAAQEERKKTSSTVVDPTADWTTYSSKEGQYSLKYPKTWATAAHPESCTPGTLLLGANADITGICGSDGGGQIVVSSHDGDQRADIELTSKYYLDLKTETVTVSGVTGKKQSGTFKSPPNEVMGPGFVDGDKRVVYAFYTKNKTYLASYSIRSAYPDVLSDFNLMMTKTFKFSN
jgi:type II secretory pathway pseudopilin PulG